MIGMFFESLATGLGVLFTGIRLVWNVVAPPLAIILLAFAIFSFLMILVIIWNNKKHEVEEEPALDHDLSAEEADDDGDGEEDDGDGGDGDDAD